MNSEFALIKNNHITEGIFVALEPPHERLPLIKSTSECY